MAAKFSLTGVLKLVDTQFKAGLRSSENAAKKFGKAVAKDFRSLSGPMSKIGAALGAYFGAKAFGQGIEKALEQGKALKAMSEQTGAAISSLYMLKYAFQEAGVESDGMAISLAHMQKTIAEAEMNGASGQGPLYMLRLDVQKLIGLRPEQQFKAIGEAIAKVQDPALKTALAMEIFSRHGAALIPVFQHLGGVDFGGLDKKAQLLEQSAQRFEDARIALARLGRSSEGFFMGVTASLAPTLTVMAEAFTPAKALAWGSAIGYGIAKAVQVVTAIVGAFPAIAGLIMAVIGVGFIKLENFLISLPLKFFVLFDAGIMMLIREFMNVAMIFGAELAQALGEAIAGVAGNISNLEAVFEYVFRIAFKFFKNGWNDVAKFVEGTLSYAIHTAMMKIGEIPKVGEYLGLDKYVAPTLHSEITSAGKNRGPDSEDNPDLDEIRSRMWNESPGRKFGQGLSASSYENKTRATDALSPDFKRFTDTVGRVMKSGSLDVLGNGSGAMEVWGKALKDIAESFTKVMKDVAAVEKKKDDDPKPIEIDFSKGLHTGTLGQQNLSSYSNQFLRHAGMNAIIDKAVAQGQQRPAYSAGAYHAIRQGDHARQKAYNKDQEQKKQEAAFLREGIDGLNDRMDKYWGPSAN